MGTFPREWCFPKHDALHNAAPFDAGGLGRRSSPSSDYESREWGRPETRRFAYRIRVDPSRFFFCLVEPAPLQAAASQVLVHGIELDTIGRQFEPCRWRPCGVVSEKSW